MARILALLMLAALVGAGWIAWSGLERPAPSAEKAAVAPPQTVEPTTPVPTPQVTEPPTADVVEQAPAPRRAPGFDVVRVEPNGSAMVAGVAEPYSRVAVIVDGEEVATFEADAVGNFVGFLDLPRSDEVRRVEVVARDSDGTETAGDEPIFVAASSANQPEAPLIVAAREAGVEVMQQAARAEDDPVSLDLVSYTPGGVLAASGRGNVLRLVRIYANAQLVAETMVREDGTWSIETTTSLAAGEHTLRVDEIGADGQVESRIEAPFIGPPMTAVALAPGEVQVETGETLWRLAERAYGDGLRFTTIYRANSDRIRDPDLIFPGQILTIPSATIRP